MKKTIMLIAAIMMVMTLVSCGEEEVKPNVVHDISEQVITETIIEEDVIEETIVDSEGYVLDISSDELLDLRERYLNGQISEEYYSETLYNARKYPGNH